MKTTFISTSTSSPAALSDLVNSWHKEHDKRHHNAVVSSAECIRSTAGTVHYFAITHDCEFEQKSS